MSSGAQRVQGLKTVTLHKLSTAEDFTVRMLTHKNKKGRERKFRRTEYQKREKEKTGGMETDQW